MGIRGSVTKSSDIDALVDSAMSAYGRIDFVVNSTGHAPGSVDFAGERIDSLGQGKLLEIDDEQWHESMDLYLLNVIRMARKVTPLMQASGGGALVNISASSAREHNFAYPVSSTLRPALSAFTKLYADRYGRDGIRMNNVLPGYLGNWEWPPELIARIPSGRAGTPEEIAKVVAFLLSPDAAYMTGQDIVVDGGYTRQNVELFVEKPGKNSIGAVTADYRRYNRE